MAAGEVVWVGLEPLGDRDGRIALYLTESLPLLLPPAELQTNNRPLSDRAQRVLEFLSRSGASFFASIHAAAGGGYPRETLDALWDLVWSSQITNDTFHPVRTLIASRAEERDRKPLPTGAPPGSPELLRRIRSRTSAGAPPQGRWSLVHQRIATALTPTQWSANLAQQLLTRHGIVMRDTAVAECVPGAYNTLYPALKTMEENGWIRRGMFVAALGAAQFAMPAAVDMLRNLRNEPATPEAIALAATDPANPYGTILPWPRLESPPAADSSDHHGMSRTSGASVILINGQLVAFFRRRNPSIRVFLPESEPERSHYAHELAKKLAELAVRRQGRRTGLLIGEINDRLAREHLLARHLEEAGFINTALGFQMRRVTPFHPSLLATPELDDNDDENISETA
jgi:ATP-dependent Lhr-like helicase